MSKEIKILAVIALVIIVGALIGSNYYQKSVGNERIGANTTTNSNSVPANIGSATAVSAETLVQPDSVSRGPDDAKITLVEFYDPECEACAAFAPNLKQIATDYAGTVRIVSRYMPFHPNSVLAASYTEAAGEQGKFAEMQTMLFERQKEWGLIHGASEKETNKDVEAQFQKYAKELGLDLKKLDAAIKSGKFAEKVDRDKKDGQEIGVRQTPTFFVNGRKLLKYSADALRELIDEELAQP